MHRSFLASFFVTTLLCAGQVIADPAIIAADIQTGVILSSNNIDTKQDPYIIGKLGLLFLSLNDVMTGDIDPDADIEVPSKNKAPFADLLSIATQENSASPLATTLVARTVAQSPNILNERMNALFRQIGMRGTKLETVRTSTGEPSWSGFTTTRDIARITTALLRTHGKYAKTLLPKDPFSERLDNWYYRDGMCLLVSQAPDSHRSFVAVIQGASSEENCHSAASVAVGHNDDRISAVTRLK